MEEFKDVLAKDIELEQVFSVEFEFDDFIFARINNHWEVQFESADGAESIIVQLESFDEKGELRFLIDEKEVVFTKDDFLRLEKFYAENSVQ